MKKNIILSALCIASTAAMAQETYENAQLATQDLNGTARYIGMGGAMEALGADISTMATNPAGIGLFRRSWAGISGGLTVQSGTQEKAPNDVTVGGFDGKNGVTNADLNQVGFVYASQVGSQSWFNLGLNYHKSRNFNMISNAVNSLSNASLNKMSFMRLASQHFGTSTAGDDRWDDMSVMDAANYDVLNDYMVISDGNKSYEDGYSASDSYFGRNDNSGYISDFNVNLSGNFNDRVYLGVSFGLKDVHYDNRSYYQEGLVDASDVARGQYYAASERKITGTGFDIKFGIIFRPIEESPFRIGAYIHTPTWYDLTCVGQMGAAANFTLDGETYNKESVYTFDYKYKMTTPWKFGLSVGHTINNVVALGATYEYADYSFVKNKIVYDYDHSIYDKDFDMDNNTKNNLHAVNTLKLGMEIKPVPEVAIRLGYNHVSPIYKSNASKDIYIYTNPSYGSVGNYYSTYDYTNWTATDRLTFGLGFALSKSVSLDIAYQYATQKGEYHPFQSLYNLNTYGLDENGNEYVIGDAGMTNIGTASTVKNNRHQISMTLGCRF